MSQVLPTVTCVAYDMIIEHRGILYEYGRLKILL